MNTNDEFENKLTLVNDEGEEVEFDVIAGINYKDDFYLILLPTSIPNAPEDEAFVFKYTEYEDGDAEYEFIDDDEILDGVFKIYEQLLNDEE